MMCEITSEENKKILQFSQLPPTSVMIQSGMAMLIMAEISASRNSIPEMIVNLSIFRAQNIQDLDDEELARRSEHSYLPPYLCIVTLYCQFIHATRVFCDDPRNRPRMHQCHPLLTVADNQTRISGRK